MFGRDEAVKREISKIVSASGGGNVAAFQLEASQLLRNKDRAITDIDFESLRPDELKSLAGRKLPDQSTQPILEWSAKYGDNILRTQVAFIHMFISAVGSLATCEQHRRAFLRDAVAVRQLTQDHVDSIKVVRTASSEFSHLLSQKKQIFNDLRANDLDKYNRYLNDMDGFFSGETPTERNLSGFSFVLNSFSELVKQMLLCQVDLIKKGTVEYSPETLLQEPHQLHVTIASITTPSLYPVLGPAAAKIKAALKLIKKIHADGRGFVIAAKEANEIKRVSEQASVTVAHTYFVWHLFNEIIVHRDVHVRRKKLEELVKSVTGVAIGDVDASSGGSVSGGSVPKAVLTVQMLAAITALKKEALR